MAFPWATALSVGGKLLGGLFGKKKDKVYTPGMKLRDTVETARQIGIHPLAALGAGSDYTVVPGTNPMPQAIEKAADDIGRATGRNLEKELIGAQIETQRAQADLLRAQSTRVQTEVKANLRNGTTGAFNVSDPSKAPALFVDVTGEKGQTIRVPDMQRAGDLETTIAARLEDGSFHKWAVKLLDKNFLTYENMEDSALNLSKSVPALREKLRAALARLKKSAAKKRPHDAGLYTP